MQYFAVLTNKKPLNAELVNMLVKPLVEISTEIPYFAAICARRRIETTRKQFVDSIKSAGQNEISLNICSSALIFINYDLLDV